jgi:hypothetical protein
MSGEGLPIAVRAHSEPSDQQQAAPNHSGRNSHRQGDRARRPAGLLVLDCETTVGAEQALLVGCYRYYRCRWTRRGPSLVCVAEGLFHPDDLADRDPAGLAVLERYVREQPPAVDRSVRDASPRLGLSTRNAFVHKVLLPALEADATVLTFGASFDLSRIGCGWAAGPWPHLRRRLLTRPLPLAQRGRPTA